MKTICTSLRSDNHASTHSVFTGRMLFLPPNQSTEDAVSSVTTCKYSVISRLRTTHERRCVCVAAGGTEESFDSERDEDDEEEPVSRRLAAGSAPLAHSRHLSTTSASRDSGLTTSNPQLYDAEPRPPADHAAPDPDTAAAAAAGDDDGPSAVTPGRHKSTAVSDDSVLGSPDGDSEEPADWWDEMVAGGTRRPMRLRSLPLESDTRGMAAAYYAQRPNTVVLDAEDLPGDLLATHDDPALGQLDDAGTPGRLRATAAEEDAVARVSDELTPVNSRRHLRAAATVGASVERSGGRSPLAGGGGVGAVVSVERSRGRSPLAGGGAVVSSPSPVTWSPHDVPPQRGRRSADAVGGRGGGGGGGRPEPSSHEEALLHRQLLRADLSDSERAQLKNSLARLLYHKSLLIYEGRQVITAEISNFCF